MSGAPVTLNFGGDLGAAGVVQAWFGTPSIQNNAWTTCFSSAESLEMSCTSAGGADYRPFQF